MERFGDLTCGDCHMIFRSVDLLDKHQDRFCIGRVAGNHDGWQRKPGKTREPEKESYRGVRARAIKTPELIRVSQIMMEV